MERNKFLLFPLIIGITLMVYSWCLSYPLSIDSSDDFVFNHVSVLYWFSLALTLPSMYLIAVTSKRSSLKWIMTLGIFMTIYSLSYFYYMLPGSDSAHTRGLTEFFIRTKNLDPSQPSRNYFQWPLFFILADITTSVSGLELRTIEFLSYATIGFLLTTVLYVHASKTYKNGGFVAVIVFFIAMFSLINYQFVPFSLAFGLFFLFLLLESRQTTAGLTIAMLVLFVGITLTHAFVPVFLILFLLIRYIVNRNKRYGKLCLLTLIIYFTMQFTLGSIGFASNIWSVMTLPTEYSHTIAVAPSASVPIDAMAQTFSRTVTIASYIICLAGFALLLVKRKLRSLDKAIFLTGAIYSGAGIILYTLGSRAIPIVFISISLGASYLVESKFRLYVIGLFLILLSLVAFVPLHNSFFDSPIQFQTKEAHTTANFMIDKFDWNTYKAILSDVGDRWYIFPLIEGDSTLDDDFSPSFKSLNIETYDSIIYSVGLAKRLQKISFSDENMSRQILGRFNVVYNSGLSYITEKPK